MRENRFTSNRKGTHPRRQQLGPSSKMRASPHQWEGSLAQNQGAQWDHPALTRTDASLIGVFPEGKEVTSERNLNRGPGLCYGNSDLDNGQRRLLSYPQTSKNIFLDKEQPAVSRDIKSTTQGKSL